MPDAVERAEAFAFYRAGLATALYLDREGREHLWSEEADAAWRAYDATLPSSIRLDLALKNLAMLHPGAFAPGPVFQLAGWYDDDPWGVGFERPPRDELAALLRKRTTPADLTGAVQLAREAWDVAPPAGVSPPASLSPSSQLLVSGARAMAAVAGWLRSRPEHQVRSQVLLVSDKPAARHLLGIAAALGREQGVPRMIRSFPNPAEARAAAERAGATGATVWVSSSDATAAERACSAALADGWGVRERVEV